MPGTAVPEQEMPDTSTWDCAAAKSYVNFAA
jgi:hypothetical protein